MKHVIYIPGLGSTKTEKREKQAMALWPKSIRIHYFPSRWSTEETADDKFKRLKDWFAALPIEEGDSRIVVAISAGGSLATRFVYEHDVARIYFVSCKIKGAASIGASYRESSPALVEMVEASETLLNQPQHIANKTTIVRPLFDTVIPMRDMNINSAKRHRRLPAVGHVSGIALALLCYFPFSLRRGRHL